MSLKQNLYEICTKNKQIAEAIAALFLKNDITNCCEEGFAESVYLQIKAAFSQEKTVSLGFAPTIKASGKQCYGTFFMEIPKNIIEIYTLPMPPLERPSQRIQI